VGDFGSPPPKRKGDVEARTAVISGLILAAGLSRRMGRPKQLLPYGDATLLSHAVAVALASPLDEVVVVLSSEVAAASDPVALLDVRVALNPRPEDGQSGSLLLGLRALDPAWDAVVVMTVDQPFVGAVLVAALCNEFAREPSGAVVPTFEGRPSSPVVLSRAMLPLLSGLTGDVGARAVLQQRPDLVRRVELGDLAMPTDIDTPAEYDALLRESVRA